MSDSMSDSMSHLKVHLDAKAVGDAHVAAGQHLPPNGQVFLHTTRPALGRRALKALLRAAPKQQRDRASPHTTGVACHVVATHKRAHEQKHAPAPTVRDSPART